MCSSHDVDSSHKFIDFEETFFYFCILHAVHTQILVFESSDIWFPYTSDGIENEIRKKRINPDWTKP